MTKGFRLQAMYRAMKDLRMMALHGAVDNCRNFQFNLEGEASMYRQGIEREDVKVRKATQHLVEELDVLEQAVRDYKEALQNTLDEVRHEFWQDCSFGVTEVVGPGTARMVIWADCGDAGKTVDTILEYKIKPFQSPPDEVVDVARDLLSDLWGLYHAER